MKEQNKPGTSTNNLCVLPVGGGSAGWLGREGGGNLGREEKSFSRLSLSHTPLTSQACPSTLSPLKTAGYKYMPLQLNTGTLLKKKKKKREKNIHIVIHMHTPSATMIHEAWKSWLLAPAVVNVRLPDRCRCCSLAVSQLCFHLGNQLYDRDHNPPHCDEKASLPIQRSAVVVI